MGELPYICVRQRAGPLVKECRSLRPRLSHLDTPFERREKNMILLPRGDTSVGRTRVDRLELRLALFGFEGSFYTLTFDDDHLPANFREAELVWRSFYRRMRLWLEKPFDYVYNIEGQHGDHRYHLHLVVRDSDFAPAVIRYLWNRGWADDEPLLRGRGDSYRRIARYMLKEPTDGITIPIGKRVCRWSQSLNEKLPAAERFWAERDTIRIPKNATSHGSYQTQNEFGSYKFAWYIKEKKTGIPYS